MEEEQGPILAAPHFYWGACNVCGATASKGKPLKRCSRCHAMYYCSADHQKAQWRRHKSLCGHLAAAAHTAGQETFFCGAADSGGEEWKVFRRNAVLTAQVLLARPLELWEQEVLLFPRTCRTPGCHRATGELQDCAGCHCVTYCSSQHREEDAGRHAAMCRHLRLCRLLDRKEAVVGVGLPAIPATIDLTYLGSAPDISHFLEQPWTGGEAVTTMESDWAFLTLQLSGVLTLLDTASRFVEGLGEREELVVHVVGANVTEMMGLIKWEYLLHRLPALTSLTYVFVGPELQEEAADSPSVPPCPACMGRGRVVEYSVHCGTYRDFLTTSPDPPAILLVQNCGFSEYEASEDCQDWVDGWASLSSLLLPSTPLVFTSYTRGEAHQDLARLITTVEEDVEVLVRCQENPMRSHRPVRDWERDQDRDVFYSNQFVSVVRRK